MRSDKAQYIVRSHQGTTTGTERSSVLGGRRKEKARSERVAVEHSKPVRQPLGMTNHQERTLICKENNQNVPFAVVSWQRVVQLDSGNVMKGVGLGMSQCIPHHTQCRDSHSKCQLLHTVKQHHINTINTINRRFFRHECK